MKRNVLISFLGTTLDQGKGDSRWNKWRPSVGICQHEDLLISRYHMIYQMRFCSLAERVIKDIENVSPETEIIPHIIELEDPWDFQEVYRMLLDFSEKLEFNQDNENYLIHITTGTHVAQICLFLLTESLYLPGKLIQTSPAKQNKNNHKTTEGTYTVIDLDLAKYDNLAMRFKQKKLDDITFLKSGIQTRNKSFNNIIERIETVAARSPDPVLLTGPTGAGKSRLAKRIYELKKAHNQMQGKFVEVNCATLRGEGAMSALFGHKKGAFTGAINDRPGLLKNAHKGICFLDEIGELGLDEQAMLLRAIEEKTFLPIGSDKEETSDFQLICGTNSNLKKMVNTGLFREDLLARINLWIFSLPSLKDRPEDIEPNLDYEILRFSHDSGRKIAISKEAKKLFLDFAMSQEALWKSNFRDLNGAIRRMATLAPGGRITEKIVEEEIVRLRFLWKDESDENIKLLDEILDKSSINELDLFDRLCLENVLQVCRDSDSLSTAGKKLFNISRFKKQNKNDADRLSKYLKRYSIRWNEIKEKIS